MALSSQIFLSNFWYIDVKNISEIIRHKNSPLEPDIFTPLIKIYVAELYRRSINNGDMVDKAIVATSKHLTNYRVAEFLKIK